jgi:hypothetical protein
MPLKHGKSQSTISSNISELHKGGTYSRTRKKFGKKKANKQAIAIALSEARRTGRRRGNVGDEVAGRYY